MRCMVPAWTYARGHSGQGIRKSEAASAKCVFCHQIAGRAPVHHVIGFCQVWAGPREEVWKAGMSPGAAEARHDKPVFQLLQMVLNPTEQVASAAMAYAAALDEGATVFWRSKGEEG